MESEVSLGASEDRVMLLFLALPLPLLLRRRRHILLLLAKDLFHEPKLSLVAFAPETFPC